MRHMHCTTCTRGCNPVCEEWQPRARAAATLRQVTIGTADEKLTANKDVEQRILICGNAQEKDHNLIQQINTLPPGSRVLIFCSTKRMCDQLCRAFQRQIGCNAIHGDKEQRERERVLQVRPAA